MALPTNRDLDDKGKPYELPLDPIDVLKRGIDALFDADNARMNKHDRQLADHDENITLLVRRVCELEECSHSHDHTLAADRDAFEWLNRISLLLYGEARPGAIILKRIEGLLREILKLKIRSWTT